ncbi:hypothetical protein AB0J80_31985 [Actinoplanes sp. NPDC049548]|uniref:hypothetical protein n=1 Tax=Actinoplanes sp. NPDC049548 TaxID=3155152 RepID=UPI003427A291
MRNIGRGALLAVGALGITLAAPPAGATVGTFAAATAPVPDFREAPATAYTLVLPDAGVDYVDPATGEPPSWCRIGELRITGDAGSLIFENITGHACLLGGHPGVKTAAGTSAPADAAAQGMLLAPGDRVRTAIRPATETCETADGCPASR